MLLHKRGPLGIIYNLVKLNLENNIVNELEKPIKAWRGNPIPTEQPIAQFIPIADKKVPLETWCYLNKAMLDEVFKIVRYALGKTAIFEPVYLDKENGVFLSHGFLRTR